MTPSALPKPSPNLNGRTERLGGSLKRECLSQFIFFDQQHLDYVISLCVDDYNQRRAHSARDNLPPIRIKLPEQDKVSLEDIQAKSYVGGLISSFELKAAYTVALGLRLRGIDVSTTHEAGLQNAEHSAHIAFAIAEGRVIFTQDDDFLRHHHAGVAHAGIVYLKQGSRSVGEIIRYLKMMHDCLDTEHMAGQVEFF